MFHFIAGLPRSGSTMLSAILQQNPKFKAGITSPVAEICRSVVNSINERDQNDIGMSSEQKRDMLKGIFNGYYKDEGQTIFDTSRGWSAMRSITLDLYPDSKLICMVRNIRWVAESFERMYQKDPYNTTNIFDRDVAYSVFDRMEKITSNSGVVGGSWRNTMDAYYSENSDSMLVINYDRLVDSPEEVMRDLYRFIGEDYYPHTFDNLEFDAKEFDKSLRADGLHRVKSVVEKQQRDNCLPMELQKQYDGMSFWVDDTGTKATVIS